MRHGASCFFAIDAALYASGRLLLFSFYCLSIILIGVEIFYKWIINSWKLNHKPRKSPGYRTPLEYCKQLFNFDF